MLGFVADLVKQVNGDAFALFSCFEETSVGVPDESRAAMPIAASIAAESPIHGQSDNERTRQREHNYAAYRRVISAKAARPSPVNEYGALNS
jgi:hypothetical protein